ncbi:hypothetical protein DB347_18115 [Opitutaceae bacterium EW11]|nr:hypothetical protein DB347_18115 [Opitutaceae bacterium EW11]
MAVDFFRKPETLIRDLRRRGFLVENVDSREGDPNRAMQIRLSHGLTVNWDRDSRSVWAEGPWPEVERLETALRKWYEGGWIRKLRMQPGTALAVAVVTLLFVLVATVGVRMAREKRSPAPVQAESPPGQDGSLAPPAKTGAPASVEPSAQPTEATQAKQPE